jgi:hypothetical protein
MFQRTKSAKSVIPPKLSSRLDGNSMKENDDKKTVFKHPILGELNDEEIKLINSMRRDKKDKTTSQSHEEINEKVVSMKTQNSESTKPIKTANNTTMRPDSKGQRLLKKSPILDSRIKESDIKQSNTLDSSIQSLDKLIANIRKIEEPEMMEGVTSSTNNDNIYTEKNVALSEPPRPMVILSFIL